MNILQFGRDGQLAREMAARAAAAGARLTALSRSEADLTRPEQIQAALEAHGEADLVVNAAAYTAVDRAESEPRLAMAVNGAAPGTIARLCAARGLPLVHLSTDYVFDGEKAAPWTEADAPNPLSVYGASKLAGERAVLAAGGPAIVLRTSWVFSSHAPNFVTTMLRLGAAGDVRVVDDQVGRPTGAGDIADFILAAAPRLIGGEARATGLFHFADAGAVSWCGFAQAVFDAAGLEATALPIATADYPTAAKRPRNSVLDTARLQAVFGYAPPSWRDALGAAVARLKQGG